MIRSIIHRQLSRNMFGIFKFSNEQAREQQKTYQMLQQQYQNEQNVKKRLDIMKTIINSRQLTDTHNTPNLDDLFNYYKFMVDFWKCSRNGLVTFIEEELIKEYWQIKKKFSDTSIFDKVQEQVLKESNQEKFDFLKLHQIGLLLERGFGFRKAYDEWEEGQIEQVYRQNFIQFSEIIRIAKKYYSDYTLTSQLISIQADFHHCSYMILGKSKIQAKFTLIALLEWIRELNSHLPYKKEVDFLSEDQIKEFLYFYEIQVLYQLWARYYIMEQYENCIECQNQILKRIKDNEGINRFFLELIKQFHTWLRRERLVKGLVQFKVQRKFVLRQRTKRINLFYKYQVSKEEVDQLLRFQAKMNLEDPNAQIAFYGVMLLCSAKLQEYSECQKYIDLMTHPSEKGRKFIKQLMECRYQFYNELEEFKFQENEPDPNLEIIYKDIIKYSEIKSLPVHQEVKRIFTDHFFEMSKNEQRQMRQDIISILKDQLHKGYFENDENLIRDSLEQTFKIIQINPKSRDTLMGIFLKLQEADTLGSRVIAQITEYISLLKEDQKQ